jgi:hypothetical protein
MLLKVEDTSWIVLPVLSSASVVAVQGDKQGNYKQYPLACISVSACQVANPTAVVYISYGPTVRTSSITSLNSLITKPFHEETEHRRRVYFIIERSRVQTSARRPALLPEDIFSVTLAPQIIWDLNFSRRLPWCLVSSVILCLAAWEIFIDL